MASLQPVCPASSSHLVLSIEEELAKDPKITVPERYVRVGQDPPILETPIPIPTINMKQLVSLETKDLEKRKLHECCKEWGLFQLVNHGVSSSLLEKLNDEIEGFFKLPLAEKMKYKIRPGDVQGYGTVIRSDNQRLDWGDRILAMQLFGYLGELLEMEMGEMEELFEDGMQSVRMTYYPPCPQPEMVVGLTPHSDAAGITILHQVNGVEGFQIKKDGVWIPVNFLPNAFVVNIGDILEILSNGLYNSIEHRANVNSEKERISIAMFFNPKFEAEFGPASSMLNPNNPPLFRRVGMEKYVKDFFSRSLNGRTYLDYMRIKNGEANSAN
ncbi:protein srg1 [Quercus suber]|uniref:Protein srg1 n=1 Tax=Quercus suber TaxID=58331 RepID=A0AAW0IK75_QUESU